MSKEKYIISRSNLPVKNPLIGTITIFMAMDYYNAHPYLVGAMIFLFVLMWIGFFIGLYREVCNEMIIELNKDNFPLSKKNFTEKMQEMLQEQRKNKK